MEISQLLHSWKQYNTHSTQHCIYYTLHFTICLLKITSNDANRTVMWWHILPNRRYNLEHLGDRFWGTSNFLLNRYLPLCRRVVSHSIFMSQRQDGQTHKMTETETFDYRIDYRAIIFPLHWNHFRVYNSIFYSGREVLATQMQSTHRSGCVSLHVRAGTTSQIFTIFCEHVMPLKSSIRP
jgi:hypothetical protein